METSTIFGIIGVVFGTTGMVVAIILRRRNSRVQTKTMNIILRMNQFIDKGFEVTKESLMRDASPGQRVKVEKAYRVLSDELEVLIGDSERLKRRVGI